MALRLRVSSIYHSCALFRPHCILQPIQALFAYVSQLNQAHTRGSQLLSILSDCRKLCAVLCCAVLCRAVLCCAVPLPCLLGSAFLSSLTCLTSLTPLCHAENGRCIRHSSRDTQGQDSCSLHCWQCTCKSRLILRAACAQHPCCTTAKPSHVQHQWQPTLPVISSDLSYLCMECAQ